MRPIPPLWLATTLVWVACTYRPDGDDTDDGDTDAGDTDTDEDTDTDDTDAGTNDTDSHDTGTATDTAGTISLDPTITADAFGLDCMPEVPPDPISGSFTVRYDNTGTRAAAARITSTTLYLTGPAHTSATWTFDVTPTTSGSIPAGDNRAVLHTKTPGSGSGNTPDPCDFCGGTWDLWVVWDIGGKSTGVLRDLGTIGCVY